MPDEQAEPEDTAIPARSKPITAVSALKQRELAKAIKRARFLALLPYLVK